VACGSLAQKAAQIYTTGSSVIGGVNAVANIVHNDFTVGVSDAIALAPALGWGVGKLRGAISGFNCFATGTLVATETGQKPIEQVQAGERVWACDLAADQWRLCRVLDSYVFEHVGDLVTLFACIHPTFPIGAELGRRSRLAIAIIVTTPRPAPASSEPTRLATSVRT
jgi:hypothetical protein